MRADDHAQPVEESLNRRHARRAAMLAWSVVALLTAIIIVWPLMRGMVAANDDVKFIRGEAYSGTLLENVRAGWSTQSNFRPLENLAAALCDVRTLECRLVLLIHIAGLLALIAAMRALTQRLLSTHAIALPMLVIWLLISPATTLSLWQMDSCSQTWTAALGAWAGVLALRGMDAARAGRSVFMHVIALLMVCGIALNIKEMFYGWSAGIGTAVMVAMLAMMRRERAASMRAMWLLLPIVVVPVVHLVVRWKYSALSSAAEVSEAGGGEAARYGITLGANLITNAWVSLLGVFANGPLHLVRDVQAPIVLRLLPLLALVATFIAMASAAALAVLHRDADRSRSRKVMLLACLGGLASLSVTLPMGSVSELYGFGANAASGVLIVAALLSLWHPAAAEERRLCRMIASTCALTLLITGAYGMASRAYHFDITWTQARELNRVLLAHQQSLPPIDSGAARRPEPARVFFEQPCMTGALHSQYIVPPLLAIGYEATMNWMNRTDPSRPVQFMGPRTFTPVREHDLVLTCEDLPQRQRR